MFRTLVPALFLVTAATIAQAQDESFGVWRYSCADGPCQAFFSVNETASGQPAVGLGMVHDTGADQTTLILTAPIRTALPPGAQIRPASGDPIPVQFQFCDETGCLGFVVLDEQTIARLEGSSNITVVYYRYGSTQPAVYEVPITGFAEARSRLRS
jgi:invasion protein IalB